MTGDIPSIETQLDELREQLAKLESLRDLLGDEVTDEKAAKLESEIQALVETGGGAFVAQTVEVRDGAGGEVIYDREYPLDTTEIFDWYQYFFEPSVQLGSVVMTDIPPYSTSYVTITLSGAAGSTVECGGCIFGTFYALGTAEYGATAGIIDYSRKETDDYGTTTFVRRAFSRRMVVNLMLPTAQVAKLQRILSDLRATPAMWIGSDDVTYTPLQVYGFYRDFQIDIAYPTQSYCSLEIEGLA